MKKIEIFEIATRYAYQFKQQNNLLKQRIEELDDIKTKTSKTMETKKSYMISTHGSLYKVVEVSNGYNVIKENLSYDDAESLLNILRK